MRRILGCLLIFSFLACHSRPYDPNSPGQGTSGHEPFDRHAELVFTRHARCRMDCRHITTREIHEVLDNGIINYNKSEPESHPDPKYAVEGYTAEQQHLRIIVAPENTRLIIITCIELGVEWSCHCN
ncbi:MAG TPA: DUF4258 domain-containing protein [Puia sp.]|nr:DUF4258 domain-containing protein [Puia sp.]